MKQNIINILSAIPFINNYFRGIATIFMLHRVDEFDNTKLSPNENMKVSPKFLENFIIKLKDNGYDFISLDELYNILQSQKKVKKKIVFTLDDGYKDNFTLAYPIFKKYNIPFTIYVTTNFPNDNALLWWYVLEELILKHDELTVDSQKYICKTKEQKEQVFLEIRDTILMLNQRNLLSELSKIFKDYDINWFSMNEELCMRWKDIEELSKDKLCTIAGHTKNHYAFNKLTKDELIREIIESNNEIEKYIDKKVEHFAYPFGSVNEVEEKELLITKELNFKTVTTTRNGNIYLEHKEYSNCCLPRIMLTENLYIKDIGKVRRQRIVTK